jgi:hypothetical protein
VAAAVLDHRGQDGRYVEELGALGRRRHVVDDQAGVHAAHAGELGALVVDQQQHRLLGGEEGVETGVRDVAACHVISDDR